MTMRHILLAGLLVGAEALVGSVAAQPAAQPAATDTTQALSVAKQGYFFVGGRLFSTNGDQAMAGQMFVQFQIPAGAVKP